MARVGVRGVAGIETMGGSADADSSFSLSTPAGWAGLLWVAAVLIIVLSLLAL